MARLLGKIALITGAGSGIGQCAALLFAKEGATVVINDIDSEKGEETVRLIELDGGTAHCIPVNVTDPEQVAGMISMVKSMYGRIDILFNNAGISGVGMLHEIDPDAWDRVMNVNIRGVYLPSKYVLPLMMEQRNGSIINMSSCIAEIGLARRASYAAYEGSSACADEIDAGRLRFVQYSRQRLVTGDNPDAVCRKLSTQLR